jgi:hypothetical protein
VAEAAEHEPAASTKPHHDRKRHGEAAGAYGDRAKARKESRHRRHEDDDVHAPVGFGEDMPAFMKIAVRA